MSLVFNSLFLCMVTLVIAEDYWWKTATPFTRLKPVRTTTTTTTWPSIQESCRCVRPQYCRDYYDPREPPADNCDIEGDICCTNLRYAQYIQSGTGNEIQVSSYNGNRLEAEDLGYDSSEESSESYHEITSSTTPLPKTTRSLNIEDLEGSDDEKRKAWPCGKKYFQVNEKGGGVVNYDAEFAEYPWTLALLNVTNNIPIFRCGASLIAPFLAVTAAHCVQGLKPENLIVRAGEWDLLWENETLAHQERHATSIIYHDDFDPINLNNNIALIVFESFSEARNVGIICLPNVSGPVLQPCFATGWGMRTNEVSSSMQRRMKKVELDLVFPSACQEELRKTDLGRTFKLHSSNFCAQKHSKGIDTSYGDGGDPFFCSEPSGNYSLIGIVSWGKEAYPDVPGVYTSVRKQKDWILKHMNGMLAS